MRTSSLLPRVFKAPPPLVPIPTKIMRRSRLPSRRKLPTRMDRPPAAAAPRSAQQLIRSARLQPVPTARPALQPGKPDLPPLPPLHLHFKSFKTHPTVFFKRGSREGRRGERREMGVGRTHISQTTIQHSPLPPLPPSISTPVCSSLACVLVTTSLRQKSRTSRSKKP